MAWLEEHPTSKQFKICHVASTLGESFQIEKLEAIHLQGHVDRRARKKYRGRPLSAVTLREEVTNFRVCRNWGVQAGKLKGIFPNQSLRYPKTEDKPPFQTRAEIERQVARGGLRAVEIRRLWECLYLTRPELDQLLEHIRNSQAQPFLYPMVFEATPRPRKTGGVVRRTERDLIRIPTCLPGYTCGRRQGDS